jgi:hypothetical protein
MVFPWFHSAKGCFMLLQGVEKQYHDCRFIYEGTQRYKLNVKTVSLGYWHLTKHQI